MIKAEETMPLDASDTPYLDWPRQQRQSGTTGAMRLIPVAVRLRANDGDLSSALSSLADAVLCGDVVMDCDDLKDLGLLEGTATPVAATCTDDIFTIFLTSDHIGQLQAALAEALEVLQVGRPIATAEANVPLKSLPETTHSLRSQNKPIVAVIDDGIGFLNTRFCRRDPQATGSARYRSRFHAVWLQAFQTIPSPSYSPAYVQAGQVLHSHEIDALLAQGPQLDEGAVYRALNQQLLEPGVHSSTEFGFTHGTPILDLAAGADPESNDPVLDWPLLAVQLPPEAVDNTAGTQLEPCIIDGVRWILRQAQRINDKSPVVINVSFATFAGPKDGSKPIEALIKHIIERWQVRTGRQVRLVYAFGNARRNRQGAKIQVVPGDPSGIDWCLQPDDFAPSYLELRPRDPADLARLGLVLTGPGRMAPQNFGPMPPNSRRMVTDSQGRVIGAVYHIGQRPSAPGVTTPAYLALAMAPSAGDTWPAYAPHGRWHLGFSGSGSAAIDLRIEVQRGDTPQGYRLNGRQSYLDHPGAYDWDGETRDYRQPDPAGPICRAATHSSFVTAQSDCLYVVAAARGDSLTPSLYSSDGAAWTIPGPNLCAVADRGAALQGLLACGTYTGSGRVLNGTSAAAAVTSRVIATAFDNGQLPAPSGTPEPAHLISLYGCATVTDPSRQGAGVLWAAERVSTPTIATV